MKFKTKHIFAAAALSLALPAAIPALAQSVTKAVTFARGTSSATVAGTIKGNVTMDYTVGASAGQTMTVRKTGSQIVYFNILPPGSNDVAIFVGSTSGDYASVRLPRNGTYKVRVYQMRATARRGEAGAYRLTIGVTGRPGATQLPGNAPAPAGGRGSIAGIRGMNAINAIDTLSDRGFVSVDSFSSGNTLYGIYYYRPTRLCVQTTSADNRIVDIRDIKTHPKCR